MEPPTVQIEHHPPERRRRSVVTMHQGCCCCCCCCCLHSVGGLIGAAVAPTSLLARLGFGRRDRTDTPVSAHPKPRTSAAAIYWWSFCTLILLCAIYILYYYPSDLHAIEFGGLVVLFFLPMLQLFSSMISFWVVEFCLSREKQDAAHAEIGEITIGSFVGAAAGMGLMVILLVLFLAFGALR